MRVADIDANVADYLGMRTETARYTSFDYCFNHFQAFRKQSEVNALASEQDLQLSCLQLGFYLASWGMLRGSSALLRNSVKVYAPVIDLIASTDADIWTIDAGDYDDAACATIIDVSESLRSALPAGASDILVTKIMLGVFGCIPAFDTNFKRGFGVSRFGRPALQRINEYCMDNMPA
ncbi:MAG: hypothetical protein U1E22_06045, partial [Coriobacteriia bacterium]|nr:hypothetical protein [Coriobacteriia bacterium]